MNKETDITTDSTQLKPTYPNNHFALRKLKDAEKNVEMLKRRFSVLKVKDE